MQAGIYCPTNLHIFYQLFFTFMHSNIQSYETISTFRKSALPLPKMQGPSRCVKASQVSSAKECQGQAGNCHQAKYVKALLGSKQGIINKRSAVNHVCCSFACSPFCMTKLNGNVICQYTNIHEIQLQSCLSKISSHFFVVVRIHLF